MDLHVTDPMSTQTQYPSTNATSAVTVASPALHNYSTHPGIALSAHHHSHLPEPPGYDTSQWYGATTNHPPLVPSEMPRMLSYPRYTSVTNASGHGMPQGYPTAYGPQYSEPRYLPPAVVPPTYGHVPYNYYNTLANWHTLTNSYLGMNTPHGMTMMPYEYLPQHPVVNTSYGNVVNVRNPPHTRLTAPLQFQGQPFEWPINASQHCETIPPVTNFPVPNSSIQSGVFSSPQDNSHSQSEGAISTNQINLQENILPTAPIVSLHNDSSVTSSPATKRLRLTDSSELPGPSQSAISTNSTPNITSQTESKQYLNQVLSEEMFKSVHEKLYPIRSEWSNFGLALGLPPTTIKQISKDHKTCEDCFYETLDRLFQSRELTWSKITEALKKPTLQQINLATEIERAVLEMAPPTQAPVNLVGNFSLEELCHLPVDKVWYQLGLWLGVEEQRLIKIKKKDKKLNLLFRAFLELPYESTDYKCLCKRFPDDQKEKARRLLESKKYEDFIKLFPLDKQVDARKLVEMSKSLFPRLVTALVKVGNREMAENISSSRGKSLKPICIYLL